MRIRAFWVAILVCGVVGHTRPANAQVDQQRAQAYFKEAQALCERDGGRLWGVSVCAPMVVGDFRTQTFATSQLPPDGPRPRLAGLMNTPIQWGGVTWVLLAWEDMVNATPQRRNEIVLHEMFHGVQAHFVRTFAYASGPAYGLLLDEASPGWQRALRSSDDLGVLLMNALAVQPANDAAGRAAEYGGVELRAAEQQREQLRQDRINELRRRFVDGPVLVVPGAGSGASDSRGAIVIPGSGTVYFHTYHAWGAWGRLEAEKGVFLASDGRTRRVPAPVRQDDGTFSGDGWTFKVAPGWIVREGARRGDYEVVRQH